MYQEIISFFDAHPWLTVGIFFVIQALFFAETIKKLFELKRFFPVNGWTTKKDEDDLTLIETPEDSKAAAELADEINGYIQKNNGAVEYGMIKDKTDRKIDALYEYATSKISFPTYLGLMGTFLGVFIGLECFSHGLGQGDGGITDVMVKDLISGIIVSMVTSLVGLTLMTISNWIAGAFMKKVDAQKDDFYRFVQSEVLPTLGTNVSASLNRLQSTIRKFEPSFKAVIDEFKTAFQDCTDMFKGSFADNVSVLTNAVEAMGSNMSLINENIQKQDQLLTTLRQHEVVETLDKFVVAANSFDSVTTSIQKLEEAKERIIASTNALAEKQESYNQSLEIPTQLLGRINAILDRVTTFENSINALGKDISQTQLIGNTQINLIEEQLKALKTKNRLIVGYQDTEVEELQKIYQTQSDAVEELSKAFQRTVDRNKDDIEKAMGEFQAAYNRIVAQCRAGVEEKLTQFLDALNKALDVEDANRKLSNLDRLATLESGLSELKTVVSDKSQLTDIASAIRTGNSKLEEIGRRPIVVQRQTSSGNGGNSSGTKPKRKFFGIFGRKK